MIANKPTILIYAVEPHRDLLKEICAGIEEEGVLFEVQYKENMDINCLSFDSAQDSILGTGIGVYGARAALSLRSLPKGKNVFAIEKPSLSQARNLGANAARTVKRMPFKEL